VKQKLSTHRIHEHLDLDQLKRQAKQLLEAFKAGDSAVLDQVNAHYDNAQAATFALRDAQLVLPRSFGMLSSPLSFWHHIPWLYAGNKDFHRESYLDCFRLILNACDVNVVGGFGRSILHEIAAMGDWTTEDEVAAFGRAALQAGARMDRRDDILSSTPLGWACRWGRVGLVRLLIEYGADPEENDAEAWARPRSWARKMGHHEIEQALSKG
jgi:hypothetical protein